MSQWRALGEAELCAVADVLLGAGALVMSVPATEAARVLGWKILRTIPHTVMTLDPGLGIGEDGASLPLDEKDRVMGILVDVSESMLHAGPESTAFQQDVFAAATQVLTQRYGPPTSRWPGEKPEVWWRRETLTLKLRIGWLSVDLELARNEDIDEAEEEYP
jgi:hypothetical protein